MSSIVNNCFSFFLFTSLLLIACESKDEPNIPQIDPVPPGCVSNLSSLELVSTLSDHAYTGDTLMFHGASFCPDDQFRLTFNQAEISPTQRSTDELLFIIPSLEDATVTIRLLSTDDTLLTVKENIVVYPGNGKWVKVAPFPGEARGSTTSVSLNDNGYIMGGRAYVGNMNKYFQDLYKYSPDEDSWTLLETDELFGSIGYAYGFQDRLYFDGRYGEMIIYDPEAKTYDTKEALSGFEFIASHKLFVWNDNLYRVVSGRSELSDEYVYSIYILKYDVTADRWEIFSSTPYEFENESHQISFTYVKGDEVYLAFSYLHGRDLNAGAFNMKTQDFRELPGIHVPSSDYPLLKQLFTIGDLTYFCLYGSRGTGDNAYVNGAGDILYIFNSQTETWKKSSHSFPDDFHGVATFQCKGRAFAGLSTSAASPLFSYSQDFYEFIPE